MRKSIANQARQRRASPGPLHAKSAGDCGQAFLWRLKKISEPEVSGVLDLKIRRLLCACFVKPGDAIFRERRFYREIPAMRWVLEKEGALAAHLAMHLKIMRLPSRGFAKVGGISEVCVSPAFRGMGLVRRLLEQAALFAVKAKLDYLALFGNPGIYASSGFRPSPGQISYFDQEKKSWVRRSDGQFLVRNAKDPRNWPKGVSTLYGQKF